MVAIIRIKLTKQEKSYGQDTRKSKGNKVSIKYPARLVLNEVTIDDHFPNWFYILRKRHIGPYDLNDDDSNVCMTDADSDRQTDIGQDKASHVGQGRSKADAAADSEGVQIHGQFSDSDTRNEAQRNDSGVTSDPPTDNTDKSTA